MNIYYYGQNDTIYDDLARLAGADYQVCRIAGYGEISEDALLFVDLSAIKDGETWEAGWCSAIPPPRKLLINNVRVIGITERNTDRIALDLLDNDFFDFIRYPFDAPRVRGSIVNASRTLTNEIELKSLYKIGIKLSTESNVDSLLKNILYAAMELTSSDGGSIYLVTDSVDPLTGSRLMQFEHSISDTLGERYNKFMLPIDDRSLAGYAVNTGRSLSIEDAYKISSDVPYSFNSSFDKQNNYITRSMLVVPMINHEHRIIGALQLINRKKSRSVKLTAREIVDRYVIDYDHKCELLIRSLGSQATISIETSRLYLQLHRLFESFMTASVTAVESRDPSTAGHSRRVSKLSVAIAQHINMSVKPCFQNTRFSIEDFLAIKYAGLLHDFGKIGVNENILLKAKKLFDTELAMIDMKLELFNYSLHKETALPITEILHKTARFKEAIMEANEPGKVSDEIYQLLASENKYSIKLLDGSEDRVISDTEYERLLHSRGSLSPEEYRVIQSHVEHSYKFLKLIDWPAGLERVPEIARYHHEKLDGSGYPTGIAGEEIPIESQIMCIADIFDALVSSDRPYKVKISLEKALDILGDEANNGKINKDILDLFVENRIYEIITEY